MKMKALPQGFAVIIATILGLSSQARGDEPNDPFVMASVGDSISVAFDALLPLTNKPLSWAAGAQKFRMVNSHYHRLAKMHRSVLAYNIAVAGAPASSVVEQMGMLKNQLGGKKLDYLTVMVGANDVCWWPKDHGPYLERYKSNIRKTLDSARAMNPDVKVLLVALPNMLRLYDLGKAKGCSWKWRVYPMCDPLFRANSTEDRAAFMGRAQDLNNALESIAKEQADIARYADIDEINYKGNDVSWIDCFHPSTRGQQTLADVTWDQGWYVNTDRLATGNE